MFASKGRRLLLLGGIAVAALASVSVLVMNAGKAKEPQASAQPASLSGAKAAVDARTASMNAASSPNAEANVKAGAATPPTTAPDVPSKGDASANGAAKDASSESVFQRSKYTYRSLGRTDPFRSLIQPKDGAARLFAEKLDPEMLQLVGVLTNGGERRALVEDNYGFGYVLKEGDRVLRGRVTSIGEESMKIRHTLYGVTETTTLSLVQKSQGRGLPNDRLR